MRLNSPRVLPGEAVYSVAEMRPSPSLSSVSSVCAAPSAAMAAPARASSGVTSNARGVMGFLFAMLRLRDRGWLHPPMAGMIAARKEGHQRDVHRAAADGGREPD